ncbi:hypothetical protein EJ05DRAFT_486093 [Pseudovirgaria hyperparasitica]|uniref:Uncharacterized protein n=1 Tax=Pseudovirgaria hyperparasitica TaxID=470096 RepID=A0A6A6W749_9PEZI|nr:uncharacterized protein EJ05DRAFT_486093 [Pseudovirgaria hyperparasitica]KAF2758029.1 hypothetical protein EJ05DRAFT_486093 [Pseudovirgaria hyperparasitica]
MADLTGYELARTSKVIDKDYETVWVVVTGAWRIVELAVGWYGGYDDLDIAALTIVTHYPYLYLLNTFYLLSSTTATAALAIDVLSISLPIRLLRPRSPTHSPKATAAEVPDRNIINDRSIIFITSFLGSGIYTVIILLALRVGLNSFLINNFGDIPSLAARDLTNAANLVFIFLPVGWAVREFILDPSLGSEAQPTLKDVVDSAFNPATASLTETMEHNVGSLSKRTKVVFRRTALLSTLALANTTIQVFTRVKGAELVGAVGWAALFAMPAWVVGGAYLIVGDA